MTCALTPAYTIRWRIGFYPTTPLEAAMVITIAVFLLGGAISVAVSSDHRAALGLYRAYFLEPAAFFYLLTIVLTTARRASLILLGFGIALIALAVPNIDVTLKAVHDHTLNVGGTPPTAIYTVSNAVALFEVPIVALAASVLLYSVSWWERLMSAIIVAVGTVSVLLTFSRGGYLALFAVAILLALTHRRRLWLVVLVAIVSVATLRVPGVAARLSHELSLTDPSNSLGPRVKLWAVTLRMLEHKPLFGSGLAGFSSAIDPYRQGYAEEQIYPHNILLNFWSETGILGLLSFGWLAVQTLVTSWKGWLHGSRDWRPYQLGVALFLVAVVAHGLVDVPFFKNDLSLQFWAFLALSWAATRWDHLPAAGGRVGLGDRPAFEASRRPTSS